MPTDVHQGGASHTPWLARVPTRMREERTKILRGHGKCAAVGNGSLVHDPRNGASRLLSIPPRAKVPERGVAFPGAAGAKGTPFRPGRDATDAMEVKCTLGTHVCTCLSFNHDAGPSHASPDAFTEVPYFRTRRRGSTGPLWIVHFEFHGQCLFQEQRSSVHPTAAPTLPSTYAPSLPHPWHLLVDVLVPSIATCTSDGGAHLGAPTTSSERRNSLSLWDVASFSPRVQFGFEPGHVRVRLDILSPSKGKRTGMKRIERKRGPCCGRDQKLDRDDGRPHMHAGSDAGGSAARGA